MNLDPVMEKNKMLSQGENTTHYGMFFLLKKEYYFKQNGNYYFHVFLLVKWKFHGLN